MAATISAYPLFRRTTDLPEVVAGSLAQDHPLRGSILALGNFDGFHLGHQALARIAHRLAAGRPVAVMSCEPHPRIFFCRENAPFRLTTPASKRRQLGQYGVDFIYSPLFSRAFACLSPSDFVDRILIEALGVRHVIAGPDFRFGHRRAGDMTLLTELGALRGFSVSIAPDVTHAGVRISSTLIRSAIQAGDLQGATQLLGMAGSSRPSERRMAVSSFIMTSASLEPGAISDASMDLTSGASSSASTLHPTANFSRSDRAQLVAQQKCGGWKGRSCEERPGVHTPPSGPLICRRGYFSSRGYHLRTGRAFACPPIERKLHDNKLPTGNKVCGDALEGWRRVH